MSERVGEKLNLPKKRLREVARPWNKGFLSNGGAGMQHRGPWFLRAYLEDSVWRPSSVM